MKKATLKKYTLHSNMRTPNINILADYIPICFRYEIINNLTAAHQI